MARCTISLSLLFCVRVVIGRVSEHPSLSVYLWEVSISLTTLPPFRYHETPVSPKPLPLSPQRSFWSFLTTIFRQNYTLTPRLTSGLFFVFVELKETTGFLHTLHEKVRPPSLTTRSFMLIPTTSSENSVL